MTHIGHLEVERESLVVIHDPKGRILHMHWVETMRGGKHPDAKTIEQDAQEQLSRLQPGLKAKLAFLHADPKGVQPRAAYKVDVKKRALVEIRKTK